MAGGRFDRNRLLLDCVQTSFVQDVQEPLARNINLGLFFFINRLFICNLLSLMLFVCSLYNPAFGKVDLLSMLLSVCMFAYNGADNLMSLLFFLL